MPICPTSVVRQIALAWTVVVFPALALNYVGQGALLLSDPKALDNPFYLLAPHAVLYSVVAIATVATIIASQALISGVFTMTKQGISLGFIPRMRVIFTSVAHRGQVYVPFINRVLAVACIALVLAFQNSTRLANAYGLAVAGTMIVTSVAYFEVVRAKLRWSLPVALFATTPFLALEVLFVLGGLPKVLEGGWIPLVISAAVFVIASTWRAGRRRVAQVQLEQSQPVEEFLRDMHGRLGQKYHGTAVFLTGDPEGIPFVLCHHWARTHSIDEKIVLMTLIPTTEPYVATEERVHLEWLSPALIRVTARFGFMERIDIERIVNGCARQGFQLDGADTTYYSADPHIVPRARGIFRAGRRGLYVILRRNARTVTSTLGIPPNAHAKLGIEVSM